MSTSTSIPAACPTLSVPGNQYPFAPIIIIIITGPVTASQYHESNTSWTRDKWRSGFWLLHPSTHTASSWVCALCGTLTVSISNDTDDDDAGLATSERHQQVTTCHHITMGKGRLPFRPPPPPRLHRHRDRERSKRSNWHFSRNLSNYPPDNDIVATAAASNDNDNEDSTAINIEWWWRRWIINAEHFTPPIYPGQDLFPGKLYI